MTVFSNARLVLPDRVQQGGLTINDGIIDNITGHAEGIDLQGDFLLPGIVDLHTDNLERQVLPRSNARWPSRSALLAHDAQCAAAGITTVFDALCLGDEINDQDRNRTFKDGVDDLRVLDAAGVLKTQHFLHLRCELPGRGMPTMLAEVIDDPLVRLISIMDHSPGLGQHADIPRYRRMRQRDGLSPAQVDAELLALDALHHENHAPNRAAVIEAVQARGLVIASHDDRTAAEIQRNFEDGIRIAEFPVALEAAQAAHALGMRTIAGAPNIVRGGSHSGNVSVLDLIRAGVLDALASDYVPAAMLEAAFFAADTGVISLPAAIALITAGPAEIVGLADRGRIAPGQRADLLQVRLFEGMPVIRAVWREGSRIA
jgi:alpha-D-ribose 1-methylphosphonate 5-triphosphate diphosphatase